MLQYFVSKMAIMPKRYPAVRDRCVNLVVDRLTDIPPFVQPARHWHRNLTSIDEGQEDGSTTDGPKKVKRFGAEAWPQRSHRNPQSSVHFLREGGGPSPPLIGRFNDQLRAAGHTVAPICSALRQQAVQVAARTYRA